MPLPWPLFAPWLFPLLLLLLLLLLVVVVVLLVLVLLLPAEVAESHGPGTCRKAL